MHDDVSTDGSAAIIREYSEKYPDINLYSRLGEQYSTLGNWEG